MNETSVSPYYDREFSWLKFNERVLHEAINASVPLLERIHYLKIFSSNLDEFFMKRVGGLKRQVLAKVQSTGNAGMTPQEKLSAIRRSVLPLLSRHAECFQREIRPELAKASIGLLS